MKNNNSMIQDILLVSVLFVGVFVLCKGQEDYSSSVSPMEDKEQQALYSAIQGFVGNWWNGSDLYPDPCGWTPIQGVVCDLFDGLWYVTALNIGPIYDNYLTCSQNAEFSHHLFELSHLQTLSFFNCFTSPSENPVTIPTKNWDKLSNSLESLEFRSNPGLIGTIPSYITHLKELQSLVLLQNGLGGKLPMNIGNLVKLRRLSLAGNQFSGPIPASIGKLSELLIFDSSRNNLSGPLSLTLGGLTSLLKLDLSNNKLEGELPREIEGLKNLTLLDLGHNELSGGLTQSLENMVSLREMVMSNNPKTGGDLMRIEWKNLEKLEILDLSNMGLTGNIPEMMGEMKSLRFLGLDNNNLTGTVSPKLAFLPSISSMHLNGNNLTGKLEFPVSFYGKMGSRFGAWNNPNLCYRAELMGRGRHVPYGVKSCEEETSVLEKYEDGHLNEVSYMVKSFGISRFGFDGILWEFMVKHLFIVLVCNMF